MKTVTRSRTSPAGLETGGAFSLPVLAHVGLLNRDAVLTRAVRQRPDTGPRGARVRKGAGAVNNELKFVVLHVTACVGIRLAFESGRGT